MKSQIDLAHRLQEFDSYLGTAMNVILAHMRDEGKNVINPGPGDPEVTPAASRRCALAADRLDPDCRHYHRFYSQMPPNTAWSANPDTGVLPLLGSADGLFHIHKIT